MNDKELQELEAALAECDGFAPGPWIDDGGDILSSGGLTLATVWSADNIPEYDKNRNLILRAPFFAAAVRELRETVKAREEENLKLREFLWLRHGHSIGELYGDDGEMQCSKCRLDFKRDSIDRITAAFMPDYHRNPSIDEALNGGKGDYKP